MKPITSTSLNWVKKTIALNLSSLLLVTSSSLFAQNGDSTDIQQDLDNITIYLQNLGMYFGYDLTNYCPTSNGNCPGSSSGNSPTAGTGNFTNELTNTTSTFASEIDLLTSFLGS